MKKKTKTDKIYIPHRKRKKQQQQQQHNLVLQITTRNQYTINLPPISQAKTQNCDLALQCDNVFFEQQSRLVITTESTWGQSVSVFCNIVNDLPFGC